MSVTKIPSAGVDQTGSFDFTSGLTLGDNLLFDASSKGVYLGVTSETASNLLDDYEEGDFSPGGITASSKAGRYTKIGNVVTVTIQAISNGGQSMAVSTITNLPFSPTNSCSSSGSWFLGSLTLGSLYGSGQCGIIELTTSAKLNSSISRTSTGVNGGDLFMLCISYRTST